MLLFMDTDYFNMDNLIFGIIFDMMVVRSDINFYNGTQKPLYCE
ncbi:MULTISPECIES: hypothetical protein [unclassified Enterococcus]|nr:MULTISPECIES: hypothetical protein [unclassified Enterococcus]